MLYHILVFSLQMMEHKFQFSKRSTKGFVEDRVVDQKTRHPLLAGSAFFTFFLPQSRWCRITSSKTFLIPSRVRAEHSTYFAAFTLFASISPASLLTGFNLFLANFNCVASSFLRST